MKRNPHLAVFLDLSKPFDTIDHNILLNKLEFYGIRGKALYWCKNYLTDRKQYVHYRNKNSSSQRIECGVPQASVLGPLLFIIYTNNLPDSLNGAKSILFADDTTIYISSNNMSNLYRDMNIKLDNLTDWFRGNKLSLNVTNYMIFTNTNTEQRHMELTMTNTTITPTKCVQFLGVLIDEKLKWDEHIKTVKQKINSSFFAINQAKHFLKRKNILNTQQTLITVPGFSSQFRRVTVREYSNE